MLSHRQQRFIDTHPARARAGASRLRGRRDVGPIGALIAVVAIFALAYVDGAWAAPGNPAALDLRVEETASLEVVLSVRAAAAPTFQVFQIPGRKTFVVELPGLSLDGVPLGHDGPGVLLEEAHAEMAPRAGPGRIVLTFRDDVDYDARSKGATLEVAFRHLGDRSALLAAHEKRKAENEKKRLAEEASQRKLEDNARRAAEEEARIALLASARKGSEDKRVLAVAGSKTAEEAPRLARAEESRKAPDIASPNPVGAEARKPAAEAARLAELESKRKAEEQAVRSAELAAKKHAQEEEARRIAELDARKKAEAEAEAEARRLAALAAKKQAEEETRRIAELEAKKKAEAEARRIAELEAKKKAEEEARRVAELEAKKKAEEEARRIAELEAKKKAETEARRLAELEAKKKAEDEARRLADLEAKKKADEARRLAESEAERSAAEAKRAAELAKQKADADARRLVEMEAQKKAETAVRGNTEQERKAGSDGQAGRRIEANSVARGEDARPAKAPPDAVASLSPRGPTARQPEVGPGSSASRNATSRSGAATPDASVSSMRGRASEWGFGGRSIELTSAPRFERIAAPKQDDEDFGGGDDDELIEDSGANVLTEIAVQRRGAGSRVGVRVESRSPRVQYNVVRRGNRQLVLTLFDTRAANLDVRRILDASSLGTSVVRVLPTVEEDARFRVQLVVELSEPAQVKIVPERGVLWLEIGES